ncbi:hypothetical protein ES708_33359 [subsurface metagenome]
MLLYEDKTKLKELKDSADEYLKLYEANDHWAIHKAELENWHGETSEMGDRIITMEDILMYPELQKFKRCKSSPHGSNVAKNLKHSMRDTLKYFYSISPFLFRKIYGKSYKGKLPNIV